MLISRSTFLIYLFLLIITKKFVVMSDQSYNCCRDFLQIWNVVFHIWNVDFSNCRFRIAVSQQKLFLLQQNDQEQSCSLIVYRSPKKEKFTKVNKTNKTKNCLFWAKIELTSSASSSSVSFQEWWKLFYKTYLNSSKIEKLFYWPTYRANTSKLRFYMLSNSC